MFFHRFEKSIHDKLFCSIRLPSFTNPRNWDAEDLLFDANELGSSSHAIAEALGGAFGGSGGGPAITNPGITLPDRPEMGPSPTLPDFSGKAPAITRPNVAAPTMPNQTQQAISGETISRFLPQIKQWESTTGRVAPKALISGMAEGEFKVAADNAARNKSLALQEYGLNLEKFRTEISADLQRQGLDLQRFGLDADNLFKGAALALQKHGMDANLALATYAQELKKAGMEADQAYRYAELAVRLQIGEDTARAQGGSALGSLIGAGIGGLVGGPVGAGVGAGVGGAVGGGLTGLFE